MIPEKSDRLRSLLTAKPALSDANFKELNTMIAGKDVAAVPARRMTPTPDLGQSALNTMPAATVGLFGTQTTPNPFQPAMHAAAVRRFGSPTTPNPFQSAMQGVTTPDPSPSPFQFGLLNAVSPTVQGIAFPGPFHPGIF
jgi:hypothetical protein